MSKSKSNSVSAGLSDKTGDHCSSAAVDAAVSYFPSVERSVEYADSVLSLPPTYSTGDDLGFNQTVCDTVSESAVGAAMDRVDKAENARYDEIPDRGACNGRGSSLPSWKDHDNNTSNNDSGGSGGGDCCIS